MPDITMCPGGSCPKKATCYRFTATPTPRWQSYFAVPPHESGGCRQYVPADKREERESR